MPHSLEDLEDQLRAICLRSATLMEALGVVRTLGLPDWAIAAGMVRTAVWDHLAERKVPTPVADIDVLYYDHNDTRASADDRIESRLKELCPDLPWSVRNQARMHIRNGDPPYTSTLHAMSFWLETPTCVGMRLNEDSELEILAPHGLADLFNMTVNPTPEGRKHPQKYCDRILNRQWRRKWPEVLINLP